MNRRLLAAVAGALVMSVPVAYAAQGSPAPSDNPKNNTMKHKNPQTNDARKGGTAGKPHAAKNTNKPNTRPDSGNPSNPG